MQNILESHGIDSNIQQQFSSCAAGDIPLNECWPELWIVNAADLKRAKDIVKKATAPSRNKGNDWSCPHCQEQLEEQFTACWKCGSDRKPPPLPDCQKNKQEEHKMRPPKN